MKKLRFVVLAMMVTPLFIINNGCVPPDPPIDPPEDTTETNTDTVGAGFKIGFDVYELVIDDNQTNGYYRAADSKTLIFVVGRSKKGPNGVVDGKGEIELTFPGNTTGSWSQNNQDEITIELATGEPPRRSVYSYDANSRMEITITEYGPVGGYIKGTFSGLLKEGINQRDVSNAFFTVKRTDDQ